MRKTKIICTIGPACEDEETLTKMCMAGMNVARLNFSHGTHEEHKKKIELIKMVRERLGLPIAIMLDTKGPEYRIGMFENKSVSLKEGDRFIFTTDDVMGNTQMVSVNYKHLTEELSAGDTVTLVFTFLTSLSSAQSSWFKSMVRSERSSSKSSVSSVMR